MKPVDDLPPLTRYAMLAISAALVTMALKTTAWGLTGSVGLLSDALESGVNLATAVLTWQSVRIARRPPDEEHAYGHEKFEYFASGAIGGLVIAAAMGIAFAGVDRLLDAQELVRPTFGIALAGGAALVNFFVAWTLIAAGARHRSIALEADGHHLMTDVWTSGGVVIGVALVGVTGWAWLDPVVALAVAVLIGVTGGRLLYRSAHGLMDAALPEEQMALVHEILERNTSEDVGFHAIRSRAAGARSFVSMHVQVPGEWTVQRGHDLLEQIEKAVHGVLPNVAVFTHLEPREDPRSFRDMGLDRPDFRE